MLVAAVLYFFLSYAYGGPSAPRSRTAALFAFAFLTALSVSIKRENSLLPIALTTLAAIVPFFSGGRTRAKGLGWIVLASVLVLVYATLELHIAASVASEVGEYGEFPFGVSGLASMLPSFSAAFGTFRWYLGTLLLVAVGLFVAFRERGLALYPAVLLVAYLLLYSTHVRSYYQLQAADVAPVDALRYSMNLMALWSVLAGVGGGQMLKYLFKVLPLRLRFAQVCGAVVVLVAAIESYRVTKSLQEEWMTDEYFSRIEPALIAARLAKESGAAILTAEPLLIQMYGDTDLNLFDFHGVKSELGDSLNSGTLLYVEHAAYSDPTTLTRYKEQLEALGRWQRREVHQGADFVIYALSLK